MALVACPECQREISTAAAACPHCGRPMSPSLSVPQGGIPPSAEEKLWRGTPSWALLFGKIVRAALAAVVLPLILYLGYDWLSAYSPALQDKHDLIFRVGWLIILAVVLVLAIQVIVALARIKSTLYTITSQRVIIETGLVSKSVEDIDLRYIDDTNFQQHLLERLLGIGNVTIVSSDKMAPTYVLRGVPDPRGLREMIRSHVYQVSQRQLFTRAT
jgi:membrane protein YdbS with pleckstrin-like domain